MKKIFILFLQCVAIVSLSAQVFITELADPNDDFNGRYVELYNIGSSPVNLSGWNIGFQTNGNSTAPSLTALTGTIPANGFFIIASQTNFSSIYGFNPDQNIFISANGDDRIYLFSDAGVTLVDIYGVPGVDGTNQCQEYEDGRAERVASVSSGNTTWTASEWIINSDDTSPACTQNSGTTANVADMTPGAWIGHTSTTPTITLGSTDMNGFTYEVAMGPSATQSNSLEWANLTGNVTSLNTVNNFEFSIDGGTTWNPASVLNVLIPPFPTTSAGPISVDVRMVSSLTVGTYLDTVILYSTGADTAKVFLSGEVTAPVVPCSELFFSEYIEQGGEKYLEIYNPTSAAANLTNYDVVVYYNTNTTVGTTVALGTGSLASGATITIRNSGSSASADISSNSLNFNGNDAIALRLSGANIDILGAIGSGTNYGENKTLTRLAAIDNPNTTYDVAEWTTTSPFTIAGFGSHTSDCIVVSCDISSITAGTQTSCVPATNEYTQEVTVTYTNEPTTGTLDVNGQSFAITSSPQTVILTGLVSNGNDVDVNASFSDLAVCSTTETALFTAPANCTPSCSQLFFSEYIEQGGEKYLEIYNPTSASVNLSNYDVVVYYNSNTTAGTTVALGTGSLASGATITIRNSGSSASADISSNSLNFNGNDAIALRLSGANIDVLGSIGSGTNYGENKTLTRLAAIDNPNTTYDVAEWTTTSPFTIAGFGTHTSDCIDYVWTGATDTDWSTASNWSSNAIPNAGNEVSIPDVSAASGNFPLVTPSVTLGNTMVASNASLTISTGLVLDGTFTNNGTVTLQNGAYLDDFTHSGASFVGNIIIETTAANGVSNDQRFISSPINNPNVSEIGDDLIGPWGTGLPGTNGVAVTVDDCALQTLVASSNYGNLFEYDESITTSCSIDGWVVRSSGSLENGRGYSAYLANGSTFDFEGTPNTGSYNVSTTNSGNGVTDADGWNLIGNPYPSPIYRDSIISAGATDVQYFVTTGVYQGSFSPYLPASNIAIAQGVQAHVSANTTLMFDNSFRNTNAATWYSNENWFTHKLEVSVLGTSSADKTILFYNDDATSSYEPMYDVSKRKSKLGNPSISTVGASKELALNGMSVNDLGNIVPMNLYSGSNGNFELMFEGMETFSTNTTIYIKDLLLDVVHNIADGNYTFSANTTDITERFEIIFIPEVQYIVSNIDCEGFGGSIELVSTIGIQNRHFDILSNNTIILSDDLNNLNTDIEAGDFVLNVNDQYGGTQTYDFTIEHAESIIADFSSSTYEVEVGEVINFNNLTNNANNINWTIGTDVLSNIENLTYSFDEAGVYEISLEVSNADCSDSKSETITVVNKTTGINNIHTDKVEIYPNPVNDILNIVSQEDIIVEIYTILGEEVLESEKKTISVKNLTSGIYIIHILNNQNELISINKFVKE